MTVQNNESVRVQKFENLSDENNIICVKPLKIFLGESEVCDMTLMSEALDETKFDGNTILLKLSEENVRHSYVYIDGDMIYSFLTNDNVYKNISFMGSILTPYSIAIGGENIYFLTRHFIFIKSEKIIDDELLKSNGNSVDPFGYDVSNCRDGLFEKIRKYKVHSNYDN